LSNDNLGAPKEEQKDMMVQSRYGVIKTEWWRYITPTMIFVVAMIFLLLGLNHEQIYQNYLTNIALNSLILFIFAISMVQACRNNIDLWHVARFFKKMEDCVKESLVDQKDVDDLAQMLETKSYLVNTQHTFQVLSNLRLYGHPLFSNDHARLIKSKLGFRVRAQRSSVSFMAGLLVMLGLIGTFWGLLATIGAVGDAMGFIASQVDNMGDGGFGVIIESISKPLGGMGLAFSSSLFGLAGSLVVGFLNYAAAQAQDDSIEDFSRWIDENILPDEEVREMKGETEEENTDSEDAANGYYALTQNGVTQIGDGHQGGGFVAGDDTVSQMIFAMNQSQQVNAELAHGVRQMIGQQKEIYNSLENSHKIFDGILREQVAISASSSSMKDNIDRQIDLLQHMKTRADEQSSVERKIADYTIMNSQYLEELSKIMRSDMALIAHKTDEQLSHLVKIDALIERVEHGDQAVLGGLKDIVLQMSKDNDKSFIVQSEIPQRLKHIDKALNDNLAVMKEVAKEGNMDRMARILKEMQIFWMKMRLSLFKDDDFSKSSENEKE